MRGLQRGCQRSGGPKRRRPWLRSGVGGRRGRRRGRVSPSATSATAARRCTCGRRGRRRGPPARARLAARRCACRRRGRVSPGFAAASTGGRGFHGRRNPGPGFVIECGSVSAAASPHRTYCAHGVNTKCSVPHQRVRRGQRPSRPAPRRCRTGCPDPPRHQTRQTPPRHQTKLRSPSSASIWTVFRVSPTRHAEQPRAHPPVGIVHAPFSHWQRSARACSSRMSLPTIPQALLGAGLGPMPSLSGLCS